MAAWSRGAARVRLTYSEILLSHSGGAAFGRVERKASRPAANTASACARIAARARRSAVGRSVAGARFRCDRARPFPRFLLGWPLADVAAACARNRAVDFRCAVVAGVRAVRGAAPAERQ